MNIVVTGTNYKFSPLAVRERLAFSNGRIGPALALLRGRPVLKGTVILSTCNRVELYAGAEEPAAGITELQDFLCRFHQLGGEKVLPYLYDYKDKEALRHLLSVACGWDSAIAGETQILGQVERVFREAKNAGWTDKYLDAAFNAAITYAQKAQSLTRGAEDISIGSAAIDFIRERLGSFSGKNVLIIGTGKVTELVLKCLREERPRVIFISNRTFVKAREMARKIGQSAARFEQLPQCIGEADVIISATASPHFIITKETLRGVVTRRLLIMDLAVPRDVHPRAAEIDNVELFNLDDLGFWTQKKGQQAKLEAEKIEKLIAREADELWPKLTALEPEPVLWP